MQKTLRLIVCILCGREVKNDCGQSLCTKDCPHDGTRMNERPTESMETYVYELKERLPYPSHTAPAE
ncbi:MAG: hypothetical protein KGN01_05760 [Patescibacteria group bacterium]|nr:hypothetical protein [Patescibacteria group bacterium]